MNFDLNDTIAAISTPIGEGGIGIVRISGKDAITLVEKIFLSKKGKRLSEVPSHSICYGFIIDPFDNKKIDEVLVSVMKSPHTYTREDTVEINCHGGIIPLKKILELVLKIGARLAEPGEFTKRAFLNGRMDLSQAEAVIDIIKAKTDTAERLALQQLEGGLSKKISDISNKLTDIYAYVEASIDFPEEEIEVLPRERILYSLKEIEKELKYLSNSYEEGRLFKDGISAAIVGKPNVGKSSLLNALLQKDRAIVTDMPGTTRDVIEDYINIKGLPLRIMDTAGIRETHDLAEIEGVKRSLRAIEGADIVLAVFDASRSIDNADVELISKIKDKRTIFVINKSDIESPEFILSNSILFKENKKVIKISVLKEEGIDELKDVIYREYLSPDKSYDRDNILLINIRHKEAIDKSLESLKKSFSILVEDLPLEIVALYLRESLDNLGQITGVVTTEDILAKIFSEFCIGK
jgi:tRNA modification GTPase